MVTSSVWETRSRSAGVSAVLDAGAPWWPELLGDDIPVVKDFYAGDRPDAKRMAVRRLAAHLNGKARTAQADRPLPQSVCRPSGRIRRPLFLTVQTCPSPATNTQWGTRSPS